MSSRRLFGTAAFARRAPSLVAIGNFDGVHRGHQAVLETAVRRAAANGLEPLVLTFDPHPAEVLGRGTLPALTSLPRKVSLLLRVHAELSAIVEPFTVDFSRWTPQEFAERVLREHLDARIVIVGENFHFGRDRTGDFAALNALGAELGFAAGVEPLAGDAEGVFSSTRVREALKLGDLTGAERCLGRPHAFSGRVVRGNMRGRTIGFPTANLDGLVEALPPYGVYACLVDRADPEGGGSALARGVLNIGTRPTLAAGFSVEAHLLDFDGDLYDQTLRVHLIARLRDERRFPDLDALKRQIGEDVDSARRILADRSPDREAGGAWA